MHFFVVGVWVMGGRRIVMACMMCGYAWVPRKNERLTRAKCRNCGSRMVIYDVVKERLEG
jgi:DNA-directed RNA polymerase subunit RPC12/RpoP